MARTIAKAAPEKPGKGVAVRQEKGGLPTSLTKRMAEVGGAGKSKAQEDNLVPIVVILQDNSPQCKKKDAKYIEGCEGGQIWLKSDPDPFVPGEDGMLVQPCYFDKDFVEWIPRDNGGGFVGRHRTIPADAKKVADQQNPNKVKWVRKNGNEIIETRYHICRIFREDGRKVAYVIPFSSSGHTVSRDWMFKMNNTFLPSGEEAPSFAKLYRLRTKTKTNKQGTWFLFDVEDEGWIQSEEDFEAGLALHNAFMKGEKEMDTGQMDHGVQEDSDDGRM